MDLLITILALFVTASAQHDTLKDRSSRSIYSDFDDEFGPIAYAAVPLHQPMPILRIVSPSPKYKFDTSYETELEPTRHYYRRQPVHSASMLDARVTEPSPSSSEINSAEIIYARPNKRGGFTYRRLKPARKPPAEPIVIRVHKYKVIRT